MARHKAKSEDEKSVYEMADELARETVREMYKDGKLTPYGKQIAKILDRALPPEKVDEWGWDLPRKEREEIKREAAEKRRIAEEKRIKRAAARKAKVAAAQKARSATDANVDTDAWKKIPLDKVPTDEPGKHNTFFEIVEAYRAQLKKFKKSRCDLNLVNPLIKEVRETTCTWIRRVHPEYVQYFAFQFCEWCRDAMLTIRLTHGPRKSWPGCGRRFSRRASIRHGNIRSIPPCRAGREVQGAVEPASGEKGNRFNNKEEVVE